MRRDAHWSTYAIDAWVIDRIRAGRDVLHDVIETPCESADRRVVAVSR